MEEEDPHAPTCAPVLHGRRVPQGLWGSNYEDALLVMWLQAFGPSEQRAFFLEHYKEWLNYGIPRFNAALAQASLASNSSDASLVVLHIKDLGEMMFVVRKLIAHALVAGRLGVTAKLLHET
jgi:hypothetical protein